jgi:filamentous hemagglutinin
MEIRSQDGDADWSIRQSEIFPQISSGDAIPRGQVARDFGLIPGKPCATKAPVGGTTDAMLH